MSEPGDDAVQDFIIGVHVAEEDRLRGIPFSRLHSSRPVVDHGRTSRALNQRSCHRRYALGRIVRGHDAA